MKYIQDRHALGHRLPTIDASQDYTLLGGYENDTHTVVRFSRAWDTCDDAEVWRKLWTEEL